jgi:multidrug efflux pump subunit AcrA (membrane-fusion protein)
MSASKSLTPVLIVILLMASVSGCKTKEQEDRRTLPDFVRVATVSTAEPGDRAYTGVVTARIQSDLGFRVPGKVTKRFVDVGQTVRAGDPLMRIDVTDYALVIRTQTENVEAAQSKAVQAAADEARYRGLVNTGAGSASAYDQVKAATDAAKAQLAAVEAQAQVAKDEADYSFLVADADGTVIATLAEPGQAVPAGQTVVKLAHTGPREAAVNLPETVRPALGSDAWAPSTFEARCADCAGCCSHFHSVDLLRLLGIAGLHAHRWNRGWNSAHTYLHASAVYDLVPVKPTVREPAVEAQLVH